MKKIEAKLESKHTHAEANGINGTCFPRVDALVEKAGDLLRGQTSELYRLREARVHYTAIQRLFLRLVLENLPRAEHLYIVHIL